MIDNALDDYLSDTQENCILCGVCRKDCGFLQAHGLPGEIAAAYDPVNDYALPYECSLCGLCSEVCPVSLDPGRMFLEMRREAGSHGRGKFREHKKIRSYERIGVSSLFTYYGLPRDCRTVFFPGCALPGTRPGRVIETYDHLKKEIPSLGIILDCCTKPSHDLGDHAYFKGMFHDLRSRLLARGVREVLVACPNCYKVFNGYGEGLEVTTVYERLRAAPPPGVVPAGGVVTLHDPCAVRRHDGLHEAVRDVIRQTGVQVEEMAHNRRNTLCCGEGGAAGLMLPERAAFWSEKRGQEAADKPLVTYCAGCANFLGGKVPAYHLLDLFFAPGPTLAGRVRVSRSPATYINRLKIKYHFRRRNGYVVRENRRGHGASADAS